MPISVLRAAALAVLALATAVAQEPAAPTALDLYRQLRSVGLDAQHVYQVRDASLQRDEMHLSFNDGTIAFSYGVDGRITGAFFQGEGHILVIPPVNVERFSLSSFTGSAVLDERFTTAFIRFNDDVLAELKPWLRTSDNAAEFVTRWDSVARSLSEGDALRLLVNFTRLPAIRGQMLHARLGGSRLGTFDVYFDTNFAEALSAGQIAHTEHGTFYDLWMSFASRRQREPGPRYQPHALRDSVQITRVRIDSVVEPPTDLRCTAEVTVRIERGGDRTLLFELSRYLKITQLELDGRGPLQFIQNEALEGSELARRGNDLVAVVFPEPLQQGQELTLRFTYGGAVLSEAGGGLIYVGARGAWYPNRGFSFAEYDLRFSYPREWTLVATGKQHAGEPSSGPMQSARFVSERPVPVAGFNLGRYVGAEARAGDVEVRAFATRSMEKEFVEEAQRRAQIEATQRRQPMLAMPFLPEPARNADSLARSAARSIEELSRLFGPYPFSSLALTQMPGVSSQGWPGLIFLSSYVFLSDQDRARARISPFNNILYGRVMLPHEVAHQWWGNTVLWEIYRDQWIVEALSNYSALLLLEEDDPAAYRKAMDQLRADLAREGPAKKAYREAGPVTLGARLSSSAFPDGFDIVSYGRGTWLLHMLRHMLRDATATPLPRAARGKRAVAAPRDPDELFFRVLRDLLRKYGGKSISTAAMQEAFEAVLPRSLWFEGRQSLDWFFDEWVNGVEIPRFELREVRFATRGARTVVTGKLLQKDAPERLVTSVPIYAATAAEPRLLGRVFADGEETAFRFTVPAGTKRLLIDPRQTVLRQP